MTVLEFLSKTKTIQGRWSERDNLVYENATTFVS